MRPLLSRSSIVTIAVVVMAACAGEAASPDDPLGLADLLGPWRREPIAALDPRVVAALDGVCRAFPDFPPGQELVLVDARGRGRLQAQYAGPNSTAECTNDLVIHPDGSVTGGLSSVGGGGAAQPPAGRIVVRSNSGTGTNNDEPNPYTVIGGRVGPDALRVVVDVRGIGPVTATLRDGWYMAWWSGKCCAAAKVTGYDAAGNITDAISTP